MKITLQYETQLKRSIGTASETLEVPVGSGVDDVIRAAAERHDESVSAILLNPDGTVRASLLTFVGDQQVAHDAARELSDGDTLTLMSPISGG